MERNSSSRDLIYVSNLKDVTIYSYPGGILLGKLKGFLEAAGECVDKAQNVWITDIGHGRLVEYAHGGTKPLRIIKGAIGPGCAIDPATGNLAVTTEGTILNVYKDARGKPMPYTDADITAFWFCGYDKQGNLFADGSHYERRKPFELAELRRGGSSLQTINVAASFNGPGGIQWDGKYLAVGDGETTIYQLSINGSNAEVAGTTHLGGSADFIYQFFVKGMTLIAPNNYFKNHKALSNVLFFDYPTGGQPIMKITRGVVFPHGAVISLARSSAASMPH
jgi:hypothetical protein